MPDACHRLVRADRLLRASEFRRVAQRGRRTVGRHFVMVAAASTRSDGSDAPRLGLTVSRKVGGAVRRNHVKRRVREWFRTSRAGLTRGVDWLVIARRGAAELAGPEIAHELEKLAAQARNE